MKSKKERTNRSGFALTDLLAMLALTAVAISTLLPAMQSIRERTRKEDCANRLREIAFGTHLFHAANERMPSTLGFTGAVESAGWSNQFSDFKHTSALAQVAPFMGLSELFDNADPLILDFDGYILDNGYSSVSDFWFSDESSASNAVQNVSEFTCPSDNINELRASSLVSLASIYFSSPDSGSFGLVAWFENPNSHDIPQIANARTNYTGCTGASTGGLNLQGSERGNYSGAIGWREQFSMFIFPDGISNTVMFGENVGTIQVSEDGIYQRDFTAYWFMGAVSNMRGGVRWKAEPPLNVNTGQTGFWSILNADTPDYPDPDIEPDPSQGLLGHANHARTYGFASMHPEGVNFVFLDGSVRTVGRTDDWQSLYAIGGGFDSVDDFELSRPGN